MAEGSRALRDKTRRSAFASSKGKIDKDEDVVSLDANKDFKENTMEILSNICKKQGLTNIKRISYIHALTRLIDESNKGKRAFFMNREDLLRCLRPGLVSDDSHVRAAGFRVVRYFISTAEDVIVINRLQIPNFIARSIDLPLKNDLERIQAFRLALKILILNPKHFSLAVTRSLVSLANSIGEIKDRMAYSCLAILCQLCILNPKLLIECYGQAALLRCTLEISHGRINECLVGCLLFLMNKPETRNKANIDLDYITSVYCEWERKRPEKERNEIYKTSALSVLAALRSWTGVLQMCQPNKISGIKTIVDVLHLHRYELRKAILDLLYQVFGLDHELWTNEIKIAIENINPSKHQEAWNISQRFIVAEGKDVLPHKIFHRPNLSEIHTAFVVYTFLECGLLSALVEVIVSTDAFLSIQAVILLGVVLHLIYKLLPAEIIELGPGLPTLVRYISHGSPNEKCQALMAVSALGKIHELYKKKPTPNSLFLRQLLFYSNRYKNKDSQEKYDSQRAYFSKLKRNLTDMHINESGVLTVLDPNKWNWDHIETSLQNPNDNCIRLEEIQHRNYIKKLIDFYKPSNRKYSMIEYNNKTKDRDIYTTTSFYLIDFLLQANEVEADKLLNEFLLDLSKELSEIVTSESLYKILLNPQHIINTISQHYFLMVGHLSSTHKGIRALNKSLILQTLLEIVGSCRHEYYIKLIVSSLNYNNSGVTSRIRTLSFSCRHLLDFRSLSIVACLIRIILSKAINSPVDNIRIYATELLLILARIDVHNFSKWGVELLVAQMYDENKIVAAASINILHELCYDKVYLESLLNTRPSLLHLGDKGNLLLIRFLSIHSGFILLSKANFIEPELLKWEKEFNYRYVSIIEDDLHDSLTLHQRNEDGIYPKRVTHAKYKVKDVFVYPHLYGELSKHEKGFQALVENGCIFKMAQNLQSCCCVSDLDILEMKSSLWGLSNMSTSKLGFQFLDKENLFQIIIKIAQNCEVLTVRGTAFYCICLISTTVAGANALAKYGWYSVRHNRGEKWPIVDQEFLHKDELTESKSKEKESESVFDMTSHDSNKVNSINFDLQKVSFESSVLLSKKNIQAKEEICYSEEKKNKNATLSDFDDTLNRSEGSAILVENKSHHRSYSDTYFKNKSSSYTTSSDGDGEGSQKFGLQNVLDSVTVRSHCSNRRPVGVKKPGSELKNSGTRSIFASEERSAAPSSIFSGNLSSSAFTCNNKVKSNKFDLAYKGICLPKVLAEFLVIAQDLPDSRKEDKKIQRREKKRKFLSFNEMEQVKEVEENFSESTPSDISDEETFKFGKKLRSDRKIRHNTRLCIACCTSFEKPKRQGKFSEENGKTKTDAEDLRHDAEGPTESWKHQEDDEKYQHRDRDLTPETHRSVNARYCEDWSIGRNLLLSESDHQSKIRSVILKHIIKMFNPVMVKSAKEALTQLKEAHPRAFQDVCLYSNVCNMLSSSTCRFASRNFIQGLFGDVFYDKVYDDAADVLQSYAPSASQVCSLSSPSGSVLPAASSS